MRAKDCTYFFSGQIWTSLSRQRGSAVLVYLPDSGWVLLSLDTGEKVFSEFPPQVNPATAFSFLAADYETEKLGRG